MKNLSKLVKKHKALATIAAILTVFIVLVIWNKTHSSAASVTYVMGKVERTTLISSVTGSGQVSNTHQVELKPKVSGTIIDVAVKEGDIVKSGTLIASVDARDARIALQSAEISLAKLLKAADQSTLLQYQNDLVDAQQSEEKAHDDLAKQYDDGYTAVSDSFLDLPAIMTGLNDVFYSSTGALYEQKTIYLGDTMRDYRNKAITSYGTARTNYDAVLTLYKNADRRTIATSSLETLIERSYTMVKATTDAIKDTKNAIDYMRDQQTSQARHDSDSALTSISDWTAKANGHLSDLISVRNGISTQKNTLSSLARSVTQKTEALSKLVTGTDPLDIETARLNVAQKQNAYDDYFIKAPFDGVVAKLTAKKGDSASAGTSLATLITTQQIADIPLNEIDVAKVKLGDKTTLSFDAIPDLSLTGVVSLIDTIGTVSQGVVTYNVEITFDTQDSRVKPGMSVAANIITASKPGVLTVPNSAIKTSGQLKTVDLPGRPPKSTVVETGDSNDTDTEIVSGLTEGENIIIRTVSSAAKTARSQTPSLFGGVGGNRNVIRTR